MDAYKPLKVFISQSMPIPETTVLPSGVEVPSYCRSVLKGDMRLIEKARGQKKEINVTSQKKPRCLLHYGMLAEVPEEERYHNLKKLVDLGADHEQRDEHGRTPLHLAVLLGDTKAVDVLLEAGCDTTAECHGNNLMHLATISGDPDMFQKVRELGFDPCSPTEYGFTTVHLAALYNQHQLIPLLKRYGVDVNRCSEAETTALHLQQAMMLDSTLFPSYVLQNLQSKVTRTAITCVLDYYGDVEAQRLVQELFKFEDHDAKLHPLICATMLGFSHTVKALVDLGADTACLYANLSPLHWSAAIGHLELVKYFFFKCKGESSEHMLLLSLPVISGAADVVKFLVDNNKEKKLVGDTPDSEFDSPTLVDIAALFNQPEIMKFALELEHKGVLEKSILCKQPNNILLMFFIFAPVINFLTKRIPALAPVLAITKERQSQVVSTIVDTPGCDPLKVISTEDDDTLTLLDVSIFLCQPVVVDVILNNLKQRKAIPPKHTAISIPGFKGFLPFFHVCVLSPYYIAYVLKENFPLNYIMDDLMSTFDTLVKHGYDKNMLDDKGHTCLDYAVAMELTDVVSFLRSRGVYTSGEALQKTMKEVEHLKDAKKKISDDRRMLEVENRMLKSVLQDLVSKLAGLHASAVKLEKTTHTVAQLEDEKRQLVEEKKELVVENQELKLQNEDLSRSMDVIRNQLSPLFSFLHPGSNPPTQPVTTPSTSVTEPSPAVIVSTQLPTIPVTTISPSVPVSMMSPPVPDTTPTDPLLTTPTLHQLNRHIIRQIALNWYSVGLNLDIEVVNLQIIEADTLPPSVERCCRTMFTRWLSHDEGTGGAPRLWRTVLKALKDVGYTSLVGDVERVLFKQNQ